MRPYQGDYFMAKVIVYESTDYQLFARHPLSRSISHDNLDALVISIKEKSMLDSQVIEVIHNRGEYPEIKEPFLITNGNHRFLAAKQLGVTFYYIIDEDFEKGDMARQFTASARWNLVQVLNYWCKLQRPEYLKFKQFVDDMDLDLKLCLSLVRKPSNRAHNRRIFMKGDFTFFNEMDLRKRMSKALEFLNLGQSKSCFRKSFHLKLQFFDAFFKLLDLKSFNWEHFMSKHNSDGCILGRHILQSDYYQQMVTFHGKGLDKEVYKVRKVE
jgi:hypothetical protein